jgi:hypothetical protein
MKFNNCKKSRVKFEVSGQIHILDDGLSLIMMINNGEPFLSIRRKCKEITTYTYRESFILIF